VGPLDRGCLKNVHERDLEGLKGKVLDKGGRG
jgi:hypothetical protein